MKPDFLCEVCMFSVSVRVPFRCSAFLPQSKDMCVKLTGNFKLPLVINVKIEWLDVPKSQLWDEVVTCSGFPQLITALGSAFVHSKPAQDEPLQIINT